MSKARKRQAPTLTPPLKWAGGKRWLVSHLLPYWEKHRHRRLVESFCGSLAVALGLNPARALLNDLNPHLVNFLRWLKEGLEISIPMQNEKTLYYSHRARFNQLLSEGGENSREAAELFFYLNRTGYNGLCRFNRSGSFNVPFGRYGKINYALDLTGYRTLFEGWEFTAVDFEALRLGPDDFVYADPPYDVPFTQYTRNGFSWADQVRLAAWLAAHPGPAIISNQATDRIVSLYRALGYELIFLHGPRLISCSGDRTPAQEVLGLKGV